MPFVPAICTQCGAKIEVDNTKDAAICQYCGTPFIVEKAINFYNTYNTTHNTNHINAQVVNIINSDNSDFEIVAGVLKKYKGSAVDVTIPEGVVEIEGEGNKNWKYTGAFDGCSSLKTVKLPSTLRKIGDYAFRGCESLTTIEIPNSVTSIGSFAFSGCSSLKRVNIPNSIKILSSGVFQYCSSLENIVIPNTIEKIGGHAFKNCTSLKSITIPNSVKHLGGTGMYDEPQDAFDGCSSLNTIQHSSTVSPSVFRGTPYYTAIEQREKKLREERLAKNLCPECGSRMKVSLWSDVKTCSKCGYRHTTKLRRY